MLSILVTQHRVSVVTTVTEFGSLCIALVYPNPPAHVLTTAALPLANADI